MHPYRASPHAWSAGARCHRSREATRWVPGCHACRNCTWHTKSHQAGICIAILQRRTLQKQNQAKAGKNDICTDNLLHVSILVWTDGAGWSCPCRAAACKTPSHGTLDVRRLGGRREKATAAVITGFTTPLIGGRVAALPDCRDRPMGRCSEWRLCVASTTRTYSQFALYWNRATNGMCLARVDRVKWYLCSTQL